MDNLADFYTMDYDFMESALQDARTFNTSTLVQYSAYAVGGILIAVAVGLIIFYIIGIAASARRRVYNDYDSYQKYYDQDAYGRSFNYFSGRSSGHPMSLLLIIDQLEDAFRKYDVTDKKACRERIICESLLPDASLINIGAADTFKDIFSHSVKANKKTDKARIMAKWERLRQASEDGYNKHDCKKYTTKCSEVSLKDLPQL